MARRSASPARRGGGRPAAKATPKGKTTRTATTTSEDVGAKAVKDAVDALDRSIYTHVCEEELPANVTLATIKKCLPPEVFVKSPLRAWTQVVVSVVAVLATLYLVHVSPWYLLPVSWFLCGTAATGFFVIAHDCGHDSFSDSRIINDVVGTVLMAPLIYPFEAWRIKHNTHHQHTNELGEDTAWHIFDVREYHLENNMVTRLIMRLSRGSPVFFLSSIVHWVEQHFLLSTFTPKQRPKVIVSLLVVALVGLVGMPWVVYRWGLWALVKYWVVPWVGFHFWMSTYTLAHHTAPHLPFKSAEDGWRDAEARLCLTMHVDYPSWIEFLNHDINVHVPHHVSTAIPAYRLRLANEALRAHWGKYMNEARWGLDLFRDILSKCNLYVGRHLFYAPFAYQPTDDDMRNDPEDMPAWRKRSKGLLPKSSRAAALRKRR